MDRQEKQVADSYTEQVQILTPSNLNGAGRLFGGVLMQWIDVVAGVVARRHAATNVTTAAVDTLVFSGAAYENDLIILTGHLTYVGSLAGERKLINTAYMLMVALDENERPTKVPRLALESDEQRHEWEQGLRRNALRKQRRKEEY